MQMAARIYSKVVKVREGTYGEVTYRGFLRLAAIASLLPGRTFCRILPVDQRHTKARLCVASIMNTCVGNKKCRGGNKGRRVGVGCLVHLCERRRSSDFPNGISPTSACPPWLPFGFLGDHPAHMRVDLHACTHRGIRFAERHSRLDSKLKGAASGVNKHDIRRETGSCMLT